MHSPDFYAKTDVRSSKKLETLSVTKHSVNFSDIFTKDLDYVGQAAPSYLVFFFFFHWFENFV